LVRANTVPVIGWRATAGGKVEPVLFIDAPADAQIFIFMPGSKIISLASGQIWSDYDTFAMTLITDWKRSMPPAQPVPPKPLVSGDVVGVIFS
jgi:hypothetical protein